MIDRLIEYIRDPDYRFKVNAARGLYRNMPDDEYLKRMFRARCNRPLNLANPFTYNEKIQWLKLYDRRNIYTTMVDKCSAKDYVANIIGDEYIIPSLGVWESFESIDFDSLPNQFVLKCTHDSGGIVIVKEKSQMDIKAVRKKLKSHLKRNYYWFGREWPYKNVQPRILAEEYLVDESGEELKDYKIFNFHGKPKVIQVDYNRFTDHKRNLYTTEWKFIDLSIKYPNDKDHHIKKPVCLEKMLELASELSRGYPHIRTDFYCIGEKVLFGELTLYHGSGYELFSSSKWENMFGAWINLSGVNGEED